MSEELEKIRIVFEKYGQANKLIDGSFYIVHKSEVFDEPLPNRMIAYQLLLVIQSEGGFVDWDDAFLMEAGNSAGGERMTFFFATPPCGSNKPSKWEPPQGQSINVHDVRTIFDYILNHCSVAYPFLLFPASLFSLMDRFHS